MASVLFNGPVMVDVRDKDIAPPRTAGGAGLFGRLVRPGAWVLATPGRTFLLLAVFFGLSIVQRLNLVVNNDIAWYIHSAGALLDGGELYRDIFFEVNPPLTLYLTVPPVALARFLGVFEVTVYYVYVFALCGVSLALASRLLDRFRSVGATTRRGLLLALALITVTLPAGDFGQREHLMVLLTLPYLLLAAVRAFPMACARPLAILSGVLAGIGFCIKPYFLAVPVAVEIFLLLRHRRPLGVFRPETLALAATGVVYAASLVIITPDYLATIVPLAADLYNDAYRNELGFLFSHKQLWLIPLVVLLVFVGRDKPAHWLPEALYLMIALTFFAIYLVQMKGWFYHLYPISAFLFLTLSWSAAGAMEARDASSSQSAAARLASTRSILALLLLLGLLVPPVMAPGRPAHILNLLGDSVREHAGSGPVFFFSSNTWTTFPLVTYTGVEMKSRYPALWTLPGLELRRQNLGDHAAPAERARLNEIERFTRDTVIADLAAHPPTVILVDARDRKPWYTAPFDFVDFFSKDARFKTLWRYYEKVDEIDGFEIYRRCAAPCAPPHGDEDGGASWKR